jgi:hypothetical protein
MAIDDIIVTTEVEVKVQVVDILGKCTQSELGELFREYFDDDEIIAMVSEEELLSYVRKYYSKDEVFPNEILHSIRGK